MSAATCSKANSSCGNNSSCRNQTEIDCNNYICQGATDISMGTCVKDPNLKPLTQAPVAVITNLRNTSFSVGWNSVNNAESYNVYYKKSDEANYQQIPGLTTTSTIINNLKPSSTYNLYLTACNGFGCVPDSPSNIVNINTASTGLCTVGGSACEGSNPSCCNGYQCVQAVSGKRCQKISVPQNSNPLPNAPQNISPISISDASIFLTWDLLTNAELYGVNYKVDNEAASSDTQTDVPIITIANLKPNTNYIIKVRGCNAGGCSPENAITVKTTNAQPVTTLTPTLAPFPPPCLPEDMGADGKCKQISTGLGVTIPVDPAGFVKSLFGILLSLAGGIALILIIFSGYQLMTSQGNPEKVQAAKETLTSAIVGLLFIIFSMVILQIIGVTILKIPGLQ